MYAKIHLCYFKILKGCSDNIDAQTVPEFINKAREVKTE